MFARLFVLAVLIGVPLESAAQVVGRVIASAGEVVATRGGRDVPLSVGANLENGDVVRTGEASSAQLRFADDSIVALRDKTRFAVSDFRFTGTDDGVSQAAFKLLQGGLRTLSGLIGKVRRDRYTMSSPLATVGIRGTAYALVLCQQDCQEADGSKAPDGIYGVVFDGRVSVANEGGTIEFGMEEAFFVADVRTPAQPLATRPGFLRDKMEARARREQRRETMEARREAAAAASREPAPRPNEPRPPAGTADIRPVAQLGSPNAPIVVVTDIRDASGNIALVGPGIGAGVSFATLTEPVSVADGGSGTVIQLDPDRGILERFVLNGGAQSGDRESAKVLDSGKLAADGGASWGRWSPGASVTVRGVTGTPSTGVHFIFGNVTPESFFGTPTGGITTVRYEYAGGTNPTNGQGTAGQFLNGFLNVNFLQRSVGGELIYKVDNYTYKLPVPVATPITTGRGFAGFNVTISDSGGWQCAGGSSVCGPTAFGTIDRYSVSGQFLGSRAQGIGVTYGTVDLQAGRTAGAALFRCAAGSCR